MQKPFTTKQTNPPSTRRYVFLDALRGLAALAVVLFHAHAGKHISSLEAVLPPPILAIIRHSDLGVQVFFVLSGFVIAHCLARQAVSLGYVGRFMLRRSIRLDPPYWASMALVILAGILAARFSAHAEYRMPPLSVIAGHVMYLPSLLKMPLINDIYWTLCLEIQFYLIFAGLMLLITRMRRRLNSERAFFAVLIPLALIGNLWASPWRPFFIPGLFLNHWFYFLAGVLVWQSTINPKNRLAFFVAAANIFVLAVLAFLQKDLAMAVGTGTAALILLVGKLNKLSIWLGSRPLQFLGGISYSLYLFHNPLTGPCFHLGFSLTGKSVLWEAFWFVFTAGFCVFSSWVFYRLVEKPSLLLSHRINLTASRKKPAETGALNVLANERAGF